MKLQTKMANLATPIPTHHLPFKHSPILKTKKPHNPIFLKPFPEYPRVHLCPPRISPNHTFSQTSSLHHKTLLLDTYHHHRTLKFLLKRLQKQDSSPLHVLQEDGDWSNDHFWVVIRFLRHASRAKQIPQVFSPSH